MYVNDMGTLKAFSGINKHCQERNFAVSTKVLSLDIDVNWGMQVSYPSFLAHHPVDEISNPIQRGYENNIFHCVAMDALISASTAGSILR